MLLPLAGLGVVLMGLAWLTNTPSMGFFGFMMVAFVGLGIYSAVTSGGGQSSPAFHGHGVTRGQAVRHERRHERVLDGTGVGHRATRVWREDGSWAGRTEVRNQAAWDALTPLEQAAVFMAGAMGPEGNLGCSDDLREVDARTSRSAARREARRHLSWL